MTAEGTRGHPWGHLSVPPSAPPASGSRHSPHGPARPFTCPRSARALRPTPQVCAVTSLPARRAGQDGGGRAVAAELLLRAQVPRRAGGRGRGGHALPTPRSSPAGCRLKSTGHKRRKTDQLFSLKCCRTKKKFSLLCASVFPLEYFRDRL